MRQTTILTAVLVLAAAATATLSAQTQRMANGLEFRAPAGWQVVRTTNGAVLTPPNAVTGSEMYIVALLPGTVNVQDPEAGVQVGGGKLASLHAVATGAPVPFQAEGGRGYMHSYDFVENGQRGRLQVCLVALGNSSVAAVIAAGTRELVPARAAAVLSIAASLVQTAAIVPVASSTLPPAGPLAQQWIQKLSGHKLMQFSSYSSGSSGGYNSQRTLTLSADGSYTFRTASSVSIYVPGANGTSAGRNGANGQWRIYEQNGQAMLELQSTQSGRELIVLTTDGSKTFLNGHRWLLQ
jgi:hypothetical protein